MPLLYPDFTATTTLQEATYCLHSPDDGAHAVFRELGKQTLQVVVGDQFQARLLLESHQHDASPPCIHMHLDLQRIGTERTRARRHGRVEDIERIFTALEGVPMHGWIDCTYHIEDVQIPKTSVIFGMSGITTDIDSYKVRLTGAELTFEGEEDDDYTQLRWQKRDGDITRVSLGQYIESDYSTTLLNDLALAVTQGVDRLIFNKKTIQR